MWASKILAICLAYQDSWASNQPHPEHSSTLLTAPQSRSWVREIHPHFTGWHGGHREIIGMRLVAESGDASSPGPFKLLLSVGMHEGMARSPPCLGTCHQGKTQLPHHCLFSALGEVTLLLSILVPHGGTGQGLPAPPGTYHSSQEVHDHAQLVVHTDSSPACV